MSTKAVTQIIFPGDFRVAWPFFGPATCFLHYVSLYIKSIKKHHIQKTKIKTPFIWFRSRFVFVQIWRIIFAQIENQSCNLTTSSVRFPHGMVIFWTRVLFFVYTKCVHFRKKTPYSTSNRLNIICLIPFEIQFCTTRERLLYTQWKPKTYPKKYAREVSAWLARFWTEYWLFSI
jgi:hypothetical protein